jgi:hypothetical protein
MGSLWLLIFSAVYSQNIITVTDTFYTAQQMLLANEINESGEPFAEALGYNLDDLDPFVPDSPDSIAYTLGIENYEYSRYQLGTIISRSGMGLHMMWGPVISQMAMMENDPNFDGSYTNGPNGIKEDDELMKNIMHFSELSNHAPPGNPWPQFAEFESGDPHLPQPVDSANFEWADFSTLRWDRSKMNKVLNPAAMGQTLMKQYLWAQDMESAFHDSLDNPIDPDGIVSPDSANSPYFDPTNNVYFGGDGLDGFIGLVLTAEAINKVKFITTYLAYDGSQLGSIDLMNYDPANGIQYFPHRISVTEKSMGMMLPPMWDQLQVVDASSDLFDQLSLLWGTLNFKNMMDPDNDSSPAHFAYHELFDGDPFPADMAQTGQPGPFDLMKGTSKVIYLNLHAMHFDTTNGTFVDQVQLNNGVTEQGTVISAMNAGYVLVILKKFIQEFAGTPLESMAMNELQSQANFLVTHLLNTDGQARNYFDLGQNTADANPTQLISQSAVIRGLYAAYQATNDMTFKMKADMAYDYLIAHFYVPAYPTFLTEEGNGTAVYTPQNIAVLSGALREAALVGNKPMAPTYYTRFFKAVANKMQLAEGPATGETGNDSDGDGIPYIPQQPDQLPPVFAESGTLDISVLAIGDDGNTVQNFVLEQNYPNPFNPSTTIQFRIPETGVYTLTLYNALGQKVETIMSQQLSSGIHSVQFDASHISSGVYFYQLKGNGYSAVRKMTLLK